jgi:hypothetical protein
LDDREIGFSGAEAFQATELTVKVCRQTIGNPGLLDRPNSLKSCRLALELLTVSPPKMIHGSVEVFEARMIIQRSLTPGLRFFHWQIDLGKFSS